jgi:hypothetical protein
MILHADHIFKGVGTRGANGMFAIKCTQSLIEEGMRYLAMSEQKRVFS